LFAANAIIKDSKRRRQVFKNCLGIDLFMFTIYLARIINAVIHVDKIIKGSLIKSNEINCIGENGMFSGENNMNIINDKNSKE
jgi:hypothetical protein